MQSTSDSRPSNRDKEIIEQMINHINEYFKNNLADSSTSVASSIKGVINRTKTDPIRINNVLDLMNHIYTYLGVSEDEKQRIFDEVVVLENMDKALRKKNKTELKVFKNVNQFSIPLDRNKALNTLITEIEETLRPMNSGSNLKRLIRGDLAQLRGLIQAPSSHVASRSKDKEIDNSEENLNDKVLGVRVLDDDEASLYDDSIGNTNKELEESEKLSTEYDAEAAIREADIQEAQEDQKKGKDEDLEGFVIINDDGQIPTNVPATKSQKWGLSGIFGRKSQLKTEGGNQARIIMAINPTNKNDPINEVFTLLNQKSLVNENEWDESIWDEKVMRQFKGIFLVFKKYPFPESVQTYLDTHKQDTLVIFKSNHMDHYDFLKAGEKIEKEMQRLKNLEQQNKLTKNEVINFRKKIKAFLKNIDEAHIISPKSKLGISLKYDDSVEDFKKDKKLGLADKSSADHNKPSTSGSSTIKKSK